MPRYIKILCNSNSIIGLQEAFRNGIFPNYESMEWLKRDYRKGSLNDEIFSKIETMLWLDKYTVRRIRIILNNKGSYAGKINLNNVLTVDQALETRTLHLNDWAESCQDIIFIFSLVNESVMSPSRSLVSLDGFLASMLGGANVDINTFAAQVGKRFENGLTPEKLAFMKGLRTDFKKYVDERHGGSFVPNEQDLANWLNSKGMIKDTMPYFGTAMDHYNFASRYGLFTMTDSSFDDWVQITAKNSAARYVATNLLMMYGVEVETALYELGYVATESVAYELIGYLCALLLI